MQYGMNENERDVFFVNILADEARRFFLTNARFQMTFSQIKQLILEEYNLNSRQIQVRRMLQSIRMDSFMVENQLSSSSAALAKMAEHINHLAPQCLLAFERTNIRSLTWVLQSLVSAGLFIRYERLMQEAYRGINSSLTFTLLFHCVNYIINLDFG